MPNHDGEILHSWTIHLVFNFLMICVQCIYTERSGDLQQK